MGKRVEIGRGLAKFDVFKLLFVDNKEFNSFNERTIFCLGFGGGGRVILDSTEVFPLSESKFDEFFET